MIRLTLFIVLLAVASCLAKSVFNPSNNLSEPMAHDIIKLVFAAHSELRGTLKDKPMMLISATDSGGRVGGGDFTIKAILLEHNSKELPHECTFTGSYGLGSYLVVIVNNSEYKCELMPLN